MKTMTKVLETTGMTKHTTLQYKEMFSDEVLQHCDVLAQQLRLENEMVL